MAFSVFTPPSVDKSLLHPMTPNSNEFQRTCMTFTSLPRNGFPVQHLHSPTVLILRLGSVLVGVPRLGNQTQVTTMLSVDVISYDESSRISGDGHGRISGKIHNTLIPPGSEVGKGIFFCAHTPLSSPTTRKEEEKRESVGGLTLNHFLG